MRDQQTCRNNMKYSDTKLDTNYDELENSIVDSLSEISIASNIPFNVQNQDLINRTISDVVSAYLWSNDYSALSTRNSFQQTFDLTPTTTASDNRAIRSKPYHSKDPQQHYFTNTSSNKKVISTAISPDENSDETIKQQSPKKHYKQSQNNPQIVPVLDFSYLNTQENSSKIAVKQAIIVSTDDESVNSNIKKENQKSVKLHQQHKQPNTQEFAFNKDSSKIHISNDLTNKSRQSISSVSIKNEIEFLLRELKLNKNLNTEVNEYYDQENESRLNKNDYDKINSMAFNLRELLARLLDKRKHSKRNINVEKMTREEIQSEKVDTQKELLSFEEKHGRPQTKLEKDLMRPLYDHYRKVKRLLVKSTSKTQNSNSEFLHEENGDEDEMNNSKDQKNFFNLHSFSIIELNKEKDISLIEKAKLKDVIKKYEIEFSKINNRSLNKEDREFHKEDFERYKILKAKLKLIDALIEKHESQKR